MLIAVLFGGRFLLRQARLPLLAQPISNTAPVLVAEERVPRREPRPVAEERASRLAAEESAPPVYRPAPDHSPYVPASERSVYVQTPGRSAQTPVSDRICKHSAYLPPEPKPAVVRPCVVKGVVEPSFNGVLEAS